MNCVYRLGSVLPPLALALSATFALANSNGPDPGNAGVTGEQTCARSGCHGGAGNLNPSGGSVSVASSSGTTYTPGQQVTLTVTITDAAARAYGFQLTARLSSNLKTQAGDFVNADTSTFVWCTDAAFARAPLEKPTAGCPADRPLQHIQHSDKKTGAANNTFTVRWTPPATAQGEITLFVAGNAANNNGSADAADRIFTATLRLAAGSTTAPRPTISSGGVIGAAAFSGKAEISSGMWVEIYGANFGGPAAGRSWAGSDFNGNNAPTSLDGTSVSIGGKPAFVAFLSPGQINVQAPADLGVGPAIVTVTNANGTSDNFTVQVAAKTPSLLAPSSFKRDNRQYLAALYADGTFVGPAGLIAGAAFRPARAGETIVTYGIGFGAVTPAVNPGVIATAATSLANLRVLFGQTQATVSYGGLAPNFVGLYQFNIVVPNGLTAGDVPISFTADGAAAQADLFTTVQ